MTHFSKSIHESHNQNFLEHNPAHNTYNGYFKNDSWYEHILTTALFLHTKISRLCFAFWVKYQNIPIVTLVYLQLIILHINSLNKWSESSSKLEQLTTLNQLYIVIVHNRYHHHISHSSRRHHLNGKQALVKSLQ